MKSRAFYIILLAFFILSPNLRASSLQSAADQIAQYLTQTDIKLQKDHELIINVVNIHSEKSDMTSQKIETELYFAMQKQFPDFKLVLLEESLTGVSMKNAVQVKGTYEQKGNAITIRVQCISSIDGTLLAQTEAMYNTEESRRKTLVAVLDVESQILNSQQRRILSEVFRTALSETKAFDMASTSDIDKMDPDKIQTATGCTRDTCATIIGEQLGVDRVISSSILRMAQNYYYVTAKIMDIKDGSILTTKSIKHQGDVISLDSAMEKLAIELTEDETGLEVMQREEVKREAEVKEEKIPEATYQKESSSNYIWHVTAITLALLSTSQSMNAATEYNDLSSRNAAIKKAYPTATPTEKNTLATEYADNQEKMTASKKSVQLYDGLTALFVVWEAYLIWSSLSDDNGTAIYLEKGGITPNIDLAYQQGVTRIL